MSRLSHKNVDTPQPVPQSKKGPQQENQLYFARAYRNGKPSEARPRDDETSEQER
jgi:hypothetical protein